MIEMYKQKKDWKEIYIFDDDNRDWKGSSPVPAKCLKNRLEAFRINNRSCLQKMEDIFDW